LDVADPVLVAEVLVVGPVKVLVGGAADIAALPGEGPVTTLQGDGGQADGLRPADITDLVGGGNAAFRRRVKQLVGVLEGVSDLRFGGQFAEGEVVVVI